MSCLAVKTKCLFRCVGGDSTLEEGLNISACVKRLYRSSGKNKLGWAFKVSVEFLLWELEPNACVFHGFSPLQNRQLKQPFLTMCRHYSHIKTRGPGCRFGGLCTPPGDHSRGKHAVKPYRRYNKRHCDRVGVNSISIQDVHWNSNSLCFSMSNISNWVYFLNWLELTPTLLYGIIKTEGSRWDWEDYRY